MTNDARAPAADATAAFVSWLVTGAVGPALVALPVNLVADKLTNAAVRWFKRLRQTDDLSRLVRAAADTSVQLSRDEIRDLRKLLEKEQTWRLLAEGKLNEKLEELTGQIAGCLPPRDGRTEQDASGAAGVITRGLVEFAVFDLQPELFQNVVLARLRQMSDQASRLDEALFGMHKDLYAFVDGAKDLFMVLMNRLPSGPADLNEIKIYLKALTDWLNTDPWPRDPRLGGPVLSPAAIERKLRLSVTGPRPEQDAGADADELARRCTRLVILGQPGSGKTWLAMRTARICAEEALRRLEDDATPDGVELPLYTTCSRLITTVGGIREAAVSSALDWIGDLGGSRIVQALSLFFAERDKPTLLVIDSLDEAGDANLARDRLRQADSLRPPWRILLTSRPSSWNNQLAIEKGGKDHLVGELQPFQYPDDVEAVIQRWFADQPEQGQALAAQIRRRPSLQQAATVPLILAFYCILGCFLTDRQPLPEFRRDLYRQVINRMLYGLWRSSSGPPPDPEACRQALRAWAWHGAKNHPVSGVGQWEDEIPTQPVQLSAAGRVAVDHIAVPLGSPDFDTDQTARRFVHRSIREHLVAEYLAGLSAKKAIRVLLPHLWYDPDWENTAPAAIAMHKEHDEVLRNLLCRATGSDQTPSDLSGVDAGFELRRLLVRVAAESAEADWSPELAAIIGEARTDLARSGVVDFGESAHWSASNIKVRQILLGQLADDHGDGDARRLVAALAQLDPTAEDKHQVHQGLLERLAQAPDNERVRPLVELMERCLAVLDATAEEIDRAGQAVLDRLALTANEWVATDLIGKLARLDQKEEYKPQARQVLLDRLASNDPHARLPGDLTWLPEDLVDMLAELDPTAEDIHRARQVLLSRLTGNEDDPWMAGHVADTLAKLDPTAEDKYLARQDLLDRLAVETESRALSALAIRLTDFDPTAEDKRVARQKLLGKLARETDGANADLLAAILAELDPSAEDEYRARQVLLGRLAAHEADGWSAAELVRTLTQLGKLDPTGEYDHRARQAVLVQLAHETDASAVSSLVDALAMFDPTGENLGQARRALLELAAQEADAWRTGDLVVELSKLDPTAEDKHRARQELLNRIAARETEIGDIYMLVTRLNEFEASAEERNQALQALLGRLAADDTDSWKTEDLVVDLSLLDPTAEDIRQARQALLDRLARATDEGDISWLLDALVKLDLTADDKRQARPAVLSALARISSDSEADYLAGTLAQLDPTAEDKREAREALLGRMVTLGTDSLASSLADTLANFDPSVRELSTWSVWTSPMTADLLAAVRRNSPLDEWLAALPSIGPL